ncbi:hypothetical protein Tco_1228814 [Tanacetum coccineum]
MADHSQNWYDGATTWQRSSHNLDDIIVITNRLDSLGCDMHKLKESIHAIHEGFLEETITKFCEESNKKQVTNDEWIRKFIEETDLNLQILGTAIKNVEVKVEKLTQAILTNEDNMVNKVKAKFEKVKEVKKMPEYLKYVEDTFSSKEPINKEDVVTDSYRKVDHRMISSDKAKQEVHRCEPSKEESDQLWVSCNPCIEKCDNETRRRDIRNLWAYSYEDERIKIPGKDMLFKD